MLKHGIISTITFDERPFVFGFRVTGKWRGDREGAQGESGGDDLGSKAHIGKSEER